MCEPNKLPPGTLVDAVFVCEQKFYSAKVLTIDGCWIQVEFLEDQITQTTHVDFIKPHKHRRLLKNKCDCCNTKKHIIDRKYKNPIHKADTIIKDPKRRMEMGTEFYYDDGKFMCVGSPPVTSSKSDEIPLTSLKSSKTDSDSSSSYEDVKKKSSAKPRSRRCSADPVAPSKNTPKSRRKSTAEPVGQNFIKIRICRMKLSCLVSTSL